MSGVASAYDETYDAERLGPYITEKEWYYLMRNVNDTLRSYWPCNCVLLIGYLLWPITLGLSLFLPNLCIREAKGSLKMEIERQNRMYLKQKGLQMSYHDGFLWTTSWLSIRILEPKLKENDSK